MKTRRDLLQGGAAMACAGLIGCGEASAPPPPPADPAPDPIPFEARVRPGWGRILVTPTAPSQMVTTGLFKGRGFRIDSPFRVASVSKMFVAELARRLEATGDIRLDSDVGELIGYPLRHPEFPTEPVTVSRLIAHQSGIIDPPVYWMAAPGNIRTLLTDEIWEPGVRPGAGFRYSNLNYGIVATALEAATRERFDRLFTRRIAEPLGLDIGFNWSGVSAQTRAKGFPGLRGEGDAWEVQIDGPDMLSGSDPTILAEPGFRLEDYEPGTNGTLFSPQGGLRASLQDLAVLARATLLERTDPLLPGEWPRSPLGRNYRDIIGPGQEDGHFVGFGDGVYVYPNGPLPTASRKMVGHHGEAYGIYCGLWAVPETGAIFVHADLGSPPDGSPLTGARPNNTEIATQAYEWAFERGGSAL